MEMFRLSFLQSHSSRRTLYSFIKEKHTIYYVPIIYNVLWFISDSKQDCNFETNVCQWSQDLTSQYKWSLHSGQTTTSNTGPSHDHTTGSCKYLFSNTPNYKYRLIVV